MRSSAIAIVVLIVFAMVSAGCWLETGRGPGDKPKGTEPVGTTPPPPETTQEAGANPAPTSPAPSTTAPAPNPHPAQTTPVK